MRSEISIHINAPPDLVYSLVSDLDHWDQWLSHYRYVRVLDRTEDGVRAAMSAWRGPIPVFLHRGQKAEPPPHPSASATCGASRGAWTCSGPSSPRKTGRAQRSCTISISSGR